MILKDLSIWTKKLYIKAQSSHGGSITSGCGLVSMVKNRSNRTSGVGQ